MQSYIRLLFLVVMLLHINGARAGDEWMPAAPHQHDSGSADLRISLSLSPQMKQHQLANMREHVETVKNIVGLMAEQQWDRAADLAHAQLGLTPEMRAMCEMSDNAQFTRLGLAFHNSGDVLGDALRSRDADAALKALKQTLQFCVDCHATFRQ